MEEQLSITLVTPMASRKRSSSSRKVSSASSSHKGKKTSFEQMNRDKNNSHTQPESVAAKGSSRNYFRVEPKPMGKRSPS